MILRTAAALLLLGMPGIVLAAKARARPASSAAVHQEGVTRTGTGKTQAGTGVTRTITGKARTGTAMTRTVTGMTRTVTGAPAKAAPEQAAPPKAPVGRARESQGPAMPVEFQTKQIRVGVTPQFDLTLPDGESRIMVENEVDRRILRLGTRYNFIFGKIKYWATYGMPIFRDVVNFEASIIDDIGYGRIYYQTKFLERARTFLAGFRVNALGLSAFSSLGRTDWKLAPFENPLLEDAGQIDAVTVEVGPAGLAAPLPDIIEPDEWRLVCRHAFLGWGGDYAFDRYHADISWKNRGLRRRDEVDTRLISGQTLRINPGLPARETFALGGGGLLRGYKYEEFRGQGILFAGTEYGIRLPFRFSIGDWKVRLEKSFFDVFVEAGRIEEDYFKPVMPLKWGTGMGLRFHGSLFNKYKAVLRGYMGQALPQQGREPVWYLMFTAR